MSERHFHPFRSEQARREFEAHCRSRAEAWPVPAETLVVETPSARTFVRASGRAVDPPLVLLAGARVSSLMWVEMIGALSGRHRTYALDTVGDAGFSVSRRRISRMGCYVDWLDEVLDALGLQRKVDLMGISLGGAIAAQYAVRRPERLRSAVLLAPAATVLRFSLGFFARFGLLSLPVPGFAGSPLRRTCRWLFEDALRGDETRRVCAEQAIDDAQLVVRVFALPPPPWPPVLADEEWSELRVPCLYLVGANEKIYSAAAAVRRLHRIAPQVKAEVIPGAGHDLTMVHPDLVAQKALDFLETAGATPVMPRR